MQLSRTQAVLMHLIERAPDLGRTQLVKLVYLVDLEARRHLGKPISDAPWKFYKFGPWWPGFPRDVKHLVMRGVVQPKPVHFAGADGETYSAAPHAKLRAGAFSPREEAILAYVLQEFGGSERAALLDVVYKTKPMTMTKRHAALPMSVVDNEGVRESGGIRLADVVKAEGQLARGEGIPLEQLCSELQGDRRPRR